MVVLGLLVLAMVVAMVFLVLVLVLPLVLWVLNVRSTLRLGPDRERVIVSGKADRGTTVEEGVWYPPGGGGVRACGEGFRLGDQMVWLCV